MAQKSFVIDTNVLIDDPNALKVLQNGEENKVYVPWTIIEELDQIKSRVKIRHRALEAIDKLSLDDELVQILPKVDIKELNNDDKILKEIECSCIDDPILVTNDSLLRLKASLKGIKAQVYQNLIPFKAESQKWTGFVDNAKDVITNSFYWEEGRLKFWNGIESKIIDYENKPWQVIPKTPYQNAAMELLLNDDINLVSIQSSAGFGKSYISLACALVKVFEEKKYNKVFVIKPNLELGESFGYVPGDLDEKMTPLFRNMHQLLIKLHDKRNVNKAFKFKKELDLDINDISSINKAKFEYLPINYMRGMNIEDSFVIVDEVQGFSKHEVKVLLTRMGQNVKCVCLGDTEQVDNPRLNQDNNGLNWLVKLCKGAKNYGHVVLKGKVSRGPICDLILSKFI